MTNKKSIDKEFYKGKGAIIENEVAKICLNCPLPKCVNPNRCSHYKEELKKLRDKNNE